MDDIVIREANSEDIRLISALGITTCYEAYFELDPSHALADYCVNFFSLETVEEEIDDKDSRHLIAELNGNACGFLKLRKGKKIDAIEGRNAIEIQRVYLLEKVKGKGIGRSLITCAEEIARLESKDLIWLGVWIENQSAIGFYRSMGFKEIGVTDFSDGTNSFVNLVFAKELA